MGVGGRDGGDGDNALTGGDGDDFLVEAGFGSADHLEGSSERR